MTDTTPGTVRRTLRALATPTSDENPAAVVDEAADVLADVGAAVRFIDADGTARVAQAVVRAVRDGDEDTVERGRAALATLREFEAACAGHSRPGRRDCNAAEDADPGPSRARSVSTEGWPNHFHPARGTVLGGAGKRGDR